MSRSKARCWFTPRPGPASSLRIGRFEFQDGSEVTAKNPTIGVIKRDRVHQRLIGPFVLRRTKAQVLPELPPRFRAAGGG